MAVGSYARFGFVYATSRRHHTDIVTEAHIVAAVPNLHSLLLQISQRAIAIYCYDHVDCHLPKKKIRINTGIFPTMTGNTIYLSIDVSRIRFLLGL